LVEAPEEIKIGITGAIAEGDEEENSEDAEETPVGYEENQEGLLETSESS
jgi:hypothetical protein